MSKSKSNGKPSQATVYHLGAEHDGRTLASTLKELLGDASWGDVKKWIAKRHIQINGNLCMDEARRVSERDVIKFWQQAQPKPVEASDVHIVHLDDHLLVVQKPAGVTSVRHFEERKLSTRRRQLQPTLEELLPPLLARAQKLRWPPLPPVGMNRGRMQTNKRQRQGRQSPIQNAKKLPPELQVFAVHRLDRDTSGLMLFARKRDVEKKLVAMFRRHHIAREYVVVCQGEIEPQTFQSLMVRDRGDGIRGSIPEDATDEVRASALKATTHIISSESIGQSENGPGYSQIRCKLETGRTHQIRIHLADAGHPVCGDRIYHRNADGTTKEDISNAPRQALHSDRLEFQHPVTEEMLEFNMRTPRDLDNWLKRLT